MEEEVRNFSFCMVLKLGFAIATAGDAAKILMLNEVLSVGDEFFRKKCLQRIEEVIHGGKHGTYGELWHGNDSGKLYKGGADCERRVADDGRSAGSVWGVSRGKFI